MASPREQPPDEIDPNALSLARQFVAGEWLQDQSHVSSLILAHEHFVLPSHLLRAVTQEYKKSSDQAVQMRLLSFIIKWVTIQHSEFVSEQPILGEIIQEFITFLKDNPFAVRLKQALEGQTFVVDEDEGEETKPQIIIKKTKKGERPCLLNYDACEIARQLTIIEHELTAKVEKKEMIKTRWLDPAKSPTLKARADRANQLAYWIAHQILSAKQRSKRKMLTHCLKICHYLFSCQNYQSLMGLYLGLSFAPVSNAIYLWQNQPSKAKAIWAKISRVMDYTNNYANFRNSFDVNQNIDAIPCQEIMLKDLLFCYDAFPDFLPTGNINLEKLHAIGSRIDEFRKHQESVCAFQKYPQLYDYLLTIPTDITMDTLTNMDDPSKNLDPKVSESESSASFFSDGSESQNGASRPRTKSTVEKLSSGKDTLRAHAQKRKQIASSNEANVILVSVPSTDANSRRSPRSPTST